MSPYEDNQIIEFHGEDWELSCWLFAVCSEKIYCSGMDYTKCESHTVLS